MTIWPIEGITFSFNEIFYEFYNILCYCSSAFTKSYNVRWVFGQLYLMLGALIWLWAKFSKHGWSHWKSTTSLRKLTFVPEQKWAKAIFDCDLIFCWLILKMFLSPMLRSAASATVRAVKKRSLIPTKAALTLVRCSQLWCLIRSFKKYPSQLFKLLVRADIFSPSRDKADGILPVSLT